MDLNQKPQTPQTAEENEKKKAYDMWAAGEGRASFDPIPGGTGELPKGVLNKIGEFRQNIGYKKFTCPTGQEILNGMNGNERFEVVFDRDELKLEKRGHNPLDLNSIKDLKIEAISFSNNSEGVLSHIICDYEPGFMRVILSDDKNPNLDKIVNASSLIDLGEPARYAPIGDFKDTIIRSPKTENIEFILSLKKE